MSKFFDSFPRLILKENRKALSMQDAQLWISLAKKHGKLCLFGLYAFSEWKGNIPIPESIILDCIALKGSKETLENLGSDFIEKGKESFLLFDGEIYLLIIEHDKTPLDKVIEPEGTSLIRDIYFKFTYPGNPNGRTGKEAKIIKRFRNLS